MSKIKLIVMDLDDTLINNSLIVTDENKEAIAKAQEQGIRVTLATGRMYRSALPYAHELGISLPLITYQGALIKDPLSNETISHQPIPLSVAQEIILEIEELGYHLNAYINDELLVKELTLEAQYYQSVAKVPMKVVGSLQQGLTEGPTKLLIINDEEKLDQLIEKWQQKFAGRLYITKSKPNFLEIMAANVDKGAGVKLLSKRLNISCQEIMAIGDSYNDLEMFACAGISVAMGNARDEIKAKATYVTASNEDSGVALAIKKYGGLK
ncbi:MAG: Cof-type HAD-IIB family hydrolase [Bacillota bacterium]|nr:Cof-type HAD-IIB family hydrolase [Bacillota bacterium]